jgi:prophage maintenance system killer protein
MVKEKPQWALPSNQYVKRPRTDSAAQVAARQVSVDALHDTGITWRPFDYQAIPASDIERTRHRFRAQLPELIWNAAALEGNSYTLPEVKTLLDGVTVGGKRVEDENQILALSEGYSLVDEMVGAGDFALTKEVSDKIHRLVAKHEAIESGHFRGEGSVTGGGTVRLASGGAVEGTPHGDKGVALREHYTDLTEYLKTLPDARERALLYFASATRRQFYFDGNKRIARLMMTGELMSNGFDLVSIPFARRLELNNALDTLFSTDDATDLLQFLTTCVVK